VAGLDGGANRLNTQVGTTLGAVGGVQTYTMITNEMPAHVHNVNPGYSTVLANAGSAYNYAAGAGSYLGYIAAYTDTQGGGAAHQNTQPTIMMNKIIKT
jgi:microcystin-dependent protein